LPKNPFFELLKSARHRFEPGEIISLFAKTDRRRVEELAARLSEYIESNLPAAFENREGLASYRTNPYVLMTSASLMRLTEPSRFADFLFNSKLYMGLEGSFGKSIEAAFVGQYPIDSSNKWIDPPEKLAEFDLLEGLNREERARIRTSSVWREIDKSCVIGNRRYLTSIKSGPNTINDTQVQAMTQAIISNHIVWAEQTRASFSAVRGLDIVIGLTYGTDKTTNNKENQILAKLMAHGFREEDRANRPGVLVDEATHSTRVYRRIGKDFWAFIGNPENPNGASFVFLEALLALSQALFSGMKAANLETRINRRLEALATALAKLQFPKSSLPEWVREKFTEDQLFWFATAMTAFYDEGI
jgi:hypothetical protein